jgi:prefoldin subunit 5
MYKRNKTLESEVETLNKTLADLEQRNKELVQLQQQQQQQQQQVSILFILN